VADVSPGAARDRRGLDTFDDMFARWIDAEARGDVVALDGLLDVDFRGDSPRGVVLTKDAWLDRYRHGDLVNRAFRWEGARIRRHAGTVFVRGVVSQATRDGGDDWSGRFRATLIAVCRAGRWSIVNLQLSKLEAPDTEARPGGPRSSHLPAEDRPGGRCRGEGSG
jgi:hypothetical protein